MSGRPRVLTQIVLLKWSESATPAQRKKAVDELRNLAYLVHEIRSIAVLTDAGLRLDNFDVAVVTSFDDADAWERYQAHPEHLRVVKSFVAPIPAGKNAVQLTGPPSALGGTEPDE